jgi:iron complex transport system substrate-binding protein
MSKIIFPAVLSFVFIAIVNCAPSRKEPSINAIDSSSFTIKYAHGFKVSDHGSYKEVEVTYPFQGAREGYHYLLVQKGEPIPAHDPATPVITIPLESIVCTSTTHIPFLDYLNETEKLIGFPTTDYISSEKMRKRIDQGKVKDLGIDKGMNLEILVTLKPSMVMGYSINNDLGQLRKIQELGIPIVVNAEYLEKHPLGRAEWIKFMALFFNKEKAADSVFRFIEGEYNKTKALVKGVAGRPTVMSGIVYGDTWFLPGGQNYAAGLLEDAGCHYLWKEDPSNGFLELSFESVYAKAKDADLWIGVGSFRSLAEIKAAEERYTRFRPFQDGKVYTYNSRQGAKGGSEFLELGYLRPDLILKDLVKIAHPEVLPEYSLYFHGQLN